MRQAAILTLIAASSAANAVTPLETRNPHETVTLNYFMEACSVIGQTASGIVPYFDCESYLYAVMDTQRALNPSLPAEMQACFPDDLPPWQLWASIGPDVPASDWNRPAAPSIARVLRKEYPCAAGTRSATQRYPSCKAAKTETELYDCLNIELKKSDAELNEAYQNLSSRYQETSAPANSKGLTQGGYLKEAQRGWIKLRDASCDFETYESRTGSGFGTIYTVCLLEQTQKRVEYLNGFIQHP